MRGTDFHSRENRRFEPIYARLFHLDINADSDTHSRARSIIPIIGGLAQSEWGIYVIASSKSEAGLIETFERVAKKYRIEVE